MAQTIVRIWVSDIFERTMKSFEQNFGTIKVQRVRRQLLKVMKEDLLQILNDSVVASLNYFYGNKQRGEMARSLRKGIKVNGQTFTNLSAIVQGVDYTLMHETNVKVQPTNSRFLAIPLPASLNADGRPKMSGPRAWERIKELKTFWVSGSDALNTHHRNVAVTDINPHFPSEVKYLVYKDETTQKLVYLYKLVPYSLLVQGYRNYRNKPLKKLGLYNRIVAGIQSASAGWYRLIWNLLETIPDFSDLKCYEDINIKVIRDTYDSVRTYSRKDIPTKEVPVALNGEIMRFAHMAAEIITI